MAADRSQGGTTAWLGPVLRPAEVRPGSQEGEQQLNPSCEALPAPKKVENINVCTSSTFGDAYESSWLDLEGDVNGVVGSGSRDRPGGWQLAAQDVVDSRRIIEELHFDPDHPNMQIFQRSFEGQSSSTLLSLSPPHSSPSWGPNARNHTEYGEPPVQDDNNGARNAYLSGLVGLAGGFKLLETDIKTTKPFIVPVDYIPLRRLEAKVECAEEGGLETGQNLGPSLQGPPHSGNDPDAGASAGTFFPVFERSQLQEDPHDLRPAPRPLPVRFPDKMHRKRAKYLPMLLRRNPLGASPVIGSSLATISPSEGHSVQYEGWAKDGLSLAPPTNPPSCSYGNGEGNMETDNAGDEDKEDNVEEMEDNEPRFDLTDDLLLKVFSFLDHGSLCSAAMVCRQWRVASAHEDFWKSLNFANRPVSPVQVAELCARYPRATELHLHLRGAPCVDENLVRETMRSLRNLEVLTLGRMFLSEMFFFALSERASLRKLSITGANLGSGGAQEIQLRHEEIRELHIAKCRVLRIAIRCPRLELLSLRKTGTASAILHCPSLTRLDVSYCHKLSDAGVRAAAVACPLLASLNMAGCAYVTDDTLREISLACAHLQTLDASYCPNISLEGVRLPMLTRLILQNCEGINSTSMVALSHCVMLEELSMDSCWLLTSVSLDLPNLRSISLAKNSKLVELTLRSPFLESLDLSQCPILNRIDLSSSSLLKLDLRQQLGLANLALHCPWLQVVDLSDCESLTDAVCNVFSDGGGCPRLNSLTLDNCDGLVKVKLSTSSLERLSLMNCKKVSSLELSCPVLHNLHLDGCDRLIEASFAPVGLQTLNLGICPHLTNLVIEADQMTALDLRGCGVLCQASIQCPWLSSLDASYCSQFGDDCLVTTTSSCPAIQNLVLAACFAVGPAGLLALKKLVDLTSLDLSYTFLTDLSPIFEACPRLKVLTLSACKYLDETALDALHSGKKLPELQVLDISYGSLGRTAIEGVLAHCPHLIKISLNGCAHVTDHLWTHLSSMPVSTQAVVAEVDVTIPSAAVEHCNTLIQPYLGQKVGSSEGEFNASTNQDDGVEEVTKMEDVEVHVPSRALQKLLCVGCQNVRSVFIPSHACLHLSDINLSLSNNIREVYLACINLTHLNLSNCPALVVLKLECPRLFYLSLQACGIEAGMIEVALRGCTMLETLDLRNCAKVSAVGLAPIRVICPGLKRLYNTVTPDSRLLP